MAPTSDPRERWRRVEEILDAVLDLPSGRRLEAAGALCSGDPDLESEVRSLVEAAESDDWLLDRPLGLLAPDLLGELEAAASGEPTDLVGRLVGPYRVVRRLGEGGMGVVFLARRADGHFDKEVALKLVPGAFAGSAFRSRFLAERQILARLEHPNIARLLDGGITEDGSPYLAMEFVDGLPIDRFCEQRKLSLEARLELFQTVCAAVDHAHHSLVVHRDLKPSNILVTGPGEVKLLDFGIAKLLDQDPSDGLTRTGQALLTPEYASPEQFRGEPVTTASDVYSLGVLLFLILAGRAPFDLAGRPLTDVSRIVLERPAPRASDAVGDESTGGFDRRRLRGDLDTIVATALSKEPERRYATAGDLSDDVGRFLAERPIHARPATWWYRAERFTRRHTVAVAAGSLLALSLVAGVAGIAWQGRVAARERDFARTEARKAEQVARFLTELFAAANPFGAEAGQLTARQLLDRGEASVRVALRDDPDALAQLLTVMSRAYNGLGDADRATALAEEALALQTASADQRRLAATLSNLGAARLDAGDYHGARRDLERALSLLEGADRPDEYQRALTLRALGTLETDLGHHEQAEAFHREALAIWNALELEGLAAGELANLATALEDGGRRDEGLELQREALEILERIHGEDHPLVATLLNNIAIELHGTGDSEAADELYQRAIEINARLLGPDHPSVADALTSYGKFLMDLGRYEEAADPIRRAAEIRRSSSSENLFYRIAAEINLATLSRELGELDDAERLYRSALARFEDLLGAEHPAHARVQSLLAQALQRTGSSEAETLYRSALAVQRSAAVPELHLAETLVGLGGVLLDSGRAAEADSLLRDALELRMAVFPELSWQVAEARSELGACLMVLGRGDDARSLLERGAAGLDATLGPDNHRTRRARSWLSQL